MQAKKFFWILKEYLIAKNMNRQDIFIGDCDCRFLKKQILKKSFTRRYTIIFSELLKGRMQNELIKYYFRLIYKRGGSD